MKVTNIDLYSDNSQVLSFNLIDPDPTDSYIFKGSSGLDADEIVPKYTGKGLITGRKFHDLNIKSREIVFKIGLNPNFSLGETSSDLRDTLYKMIASSKTGSIQLRFSIESAPVIAITGFVTKFVTSLFTEKPEVQITMRCNDPMLKPINPQEVDVSSLSTSNPVIYDYSSTAPHGLTMKITFTGAADPFIIRDSATPDWAFTIDYAFESGDQLYLSSEFGNKHLYVFEDTFFSTTHLIDKIEPGSIWPIIHPGDNTFNLSNSNFVWNEFSYYPTYWGV